MLPIFIASSSLLHHLDEVADLENHAADLRRVLVLDHVLHAADAERVERGLLVLAMAGGTLDLADLDARHGARSGGRTARPASTRAPPPPPRDAAGSGAR